MYFVAFENDHFVFLLIEKPIIQRIEFDGIESITGSEIRRVLGSNKNDFLVGSRFDETTLTRAASAIKEKTTTRDRVGIFDIKLDRPGHYFFFPEGPQATVIYFRAIECDGTDYSMRPLEVGIGYSAINCRLTFARDSGRIIRQVLEGRKPVRAFEVIAIPEAKELPSVFGYSVSSWPTKRDGCFEISG